MRKDRLDLYYEAAEHSTHVFFLWTLDRVISELRSRGVKVGYYSFLTTPLDDLDRIAEEAGAEDQMAFGFTPLADVSFLNLEDASGHPRQGARNVVYSFKAGRAKGYIGTIAMINSESELIGLSSVSFVLAASEKSALAVLERYNDLRRDILRTRKVVLDLQGHKINRLQESRWSDIFLPGDMASRIQAEISSFFESREAYESRNLAYRRGILLGGPSGNGKTSACRAIASMVDAPVLYGVLDPDDLSSCLKAAKRAIMQHAPCVAIFEDSDVFVSDDATRGHVLGLLDGVFELDGVLVIASTNVPEKLDLALTSRPGRFDSYYYFPNPGKPEARKILKNTLGDSSVSRGDLSEAVKELNGCSASFVQEVATYAVLIASAAGREPMMADVRQGIVKARRHMKDAHGGSKPIGFDVG